MTIPQITAELIKRSPYIQEGLQDGLINITALARHLKPDIEQLVGKSVKEGSIIMAINRMPTEREIYIEKQVFKFLNNIRNVSVRSDLVDYTYRVSPTLLENQLELFKQLQEHPDNFFSISRGIYETTLIVSIELERSLHKIFKKEHLISSKQDLAAAILMLPPKNVEISGIYYYILKQVAWQGINLVEMISTTNEFTLVVQRKYINDLLKVLMDLKNL